MVDSGFVSKSLVDSVIVNSVLLTGDLLAILAIKNDSEQRIADDRENHVKCRDEWAGPRITHFTYCL